MNRIGKIFDGEHRSFRIFVAIASAAFLFIWIVGPGNTIVHWVQAKLDIRNQEKAIEQYQEDLAEIDERINMLKTDKDTLEKFAREQFQFAAPGEDVYVIE